MTYVGRPLHSFLGSEVFDLLGQQADRIRRADGTIPAASEVAKMLEAVRGHLTDAAAAADGYVLAPRLAIGELVDLTDDAGETVLERGLRVVDVRDHHLVAVVDRQGRRSTHLDLVLRSSP
ncbi:hypothetical protein ACIA03_29015 [Nocardioides sp. NPDC051685]|uniref:hypothetical protein n=1 Tax=Nocardioides sp. NPDC051685 TaxID=3364334 RepID=UPI0037969DBC